jgi:hypothetical protein
VTWLRRIGLGLLVLGLAYGALYVAMAERVEVVVLHTHDDAGDHATRLWVTDDAGHAWLRTGRANQSWLPRLRAQPAVELERGGATLPFTAHVVEDPAQIARTDQLTLEKYGWSEKLLRAMGGGDPANSVVIRLDPRQPS